MSLISPLAHARGLGSAKTGTHHWWSQRLTAIFLVPLTLWFVYSLVVISSHDYYSVIAWLSNGFNATIMILFLLALFYHTLLGLQVVIEDYIESEWQKIACIIIIKIFAWLLSVASILSVLKIFLGL